MSARQFRHFVESTKTTQPRPQVSSVNCSIWRFNMTNYWTDDVIFSPLVSYACGFTQSERWQYFEWIIKKIIIHLIKIFLCFWFAKIASHAYFTITSEQIWRNFSMCLCSIIARKLNIWPRRPGDEVWTVFGSEYKMAEHFTCFTRKK